ncbi:FAD-binding domain-containing protein [Wenzhouxiangella marina]|nr:deoxyribodipyrimidine photo-lyase [Wenzhouxiangella marina]MBB6087118.1 deoxyribodipyrimidine photo-lyase [Wenzhouxiangella marina]
MPRSSLQLVWFKRDLRVADHVPLVEAARRGPVLPVYVVEPELWAQPDTARRHQAFIAESLRDLDRALRAMGQGLLVQRGDVLEVFADLHRRFRIDAIHAHEETGNAWTFERDKRVRAWCREQGIPLHETPQFGVVRALGDRDGWAKRWEALMGETLVMAPGRLPSVVETPRPVDPFDGLEPASRLPTPGRQRGGIEAAQATLDSFLNERGRHYRGGISSPLSAETAGSRFSPYIAYGNLSLRHIVQATRVRIARAKGEPPAGWIGSLRQFDRRLHWHCHFIQKFEQRPELEFRNMHSGFDGMREDDFDPVKFEAWAEGRTGYPLVDACMRFLTHTGWLNFRMRAMLMSFAGYQLWLHWREPALHLARLFTDYEPGIHYCQCQMQNGVTGINTLRIYNPVKQAQDQDPEGEFVRRWVPELEGVPTAAIFEPWKLGEADLKRYGAQGYPPPIVDHQAAAREARRIVGEFRKQPGFRGQADRIQHELGSRRSGIAPTRRPRKKKAVEKSPQQSLF